jgi:uncharacterized membrane protein
MNYSSSRLDSLADGIFAIAMTILVFDIKLPEVSFETNYFAFQAFVSTLPLFLSYLLSFATLFTYWRGYHSTVSDFAQTTDMKFQNFAAAFLFFVALVPFSSRFLSAYSQLSFAVGIFSLNVIAIGLILLVMRVYAWKSGNIENRRITKKENNHSFVRILVPVIFAMIAIFVAPHSTVWALSILTLAILFNLMRRSSRIVSRVIMSRDEESKRKI